VWRNAAPVRKRDLVLGVDAGKPPEGRASISRATDVLLAGADRAQGSSWQGRRKRALDAQPRAAVA
jgi:hypothetical protein